jgi:hypothetical protein
MDGQDLSVPLDGEDPEPREHFTLGYRKHVWYRDESYVMFSRSDGSEAKFYDVRADPQQTRDLAGEEPETVERMFKEYVLKDAGDPLHAY